jgi:iron complex transport system ATP-binding protein
MPFVLQLHEATLIRGGVAVLDRISLSIRRGEHTAILGPNGAGKSSLIRMLTLDDRPLRRSPDRERAGANDRGPDRLRQGLRRSTVASAKVEGPPLRQLSAVAADLQVDRAPGEGGHVSGIPPLRLFGQDKWDVETLRRRLGVVTGDLDRDFGSGTSGGRVLAIDVALSGLFGSQGVFAHHAVDEPMRRQARRSLEKVGGGHLANRPLNQLSTGERRRVLIARALMTNPEALVLDEPTAGLDLVARHQFMESLRGLARDGTTVILVTHHVEEIIPEMQKVVLIREGRIAFDGTPAAALTSSRLSELLGTPVSVEQSGGYFHVRLQLEDAAHHGAPS